MSTPYKRILIPLDGSKLAEGCLRDGAPLAESTGAELVLLGVVEPIRDVLAVDGQKLHVDEQMELRRAQVIRYLDEVRHRIAGRCPSCEVAVEVGAPAETILEFARVHSIDLIVMSTHGRSGISRWLLGSVAAKVIQAATTPVLISRATP